MKYLVTKIKLKNITQQNIHHLIVSLHEIDESYNDYMTYNNKGWIISYNDILAYHIEDNCIYEYIYSDKNKELFISLDDQGYSEYINIIETLKDKEYISKDSLLYIDDKPFYINDIEKYIHYKSDLPILYLNNEISSNQKLMNELAKKVQGMAYVVYGNENFNHVMKEKYNFRNNSYLIYLNDSYLKISLLKNETEYQFLERVFLKIQNYNTIRVYEYPYSMDLLYKAVLKEMILHESENEDILLTDLEKEIMSLEEEKAKLEEKINNLVTQISILEEKNTYNHEYLDEKDEYPILIKGKEREYYSGEQKDIVLFVLEESKNGQDKEYKDMIDTILEQNPKDGTREEMIEEIEKILRGSNGLTDRAKTKLRKYGICLAHNDHYACRFYNDSRYLITAASSASDYNFVNQLRRHIKKFFF